MTRFAVLAALTLTAPVIADEPNRKEIPLGDCLVVGSVGRYGRSAVHVDAIEADIVAGRWKAPKAGDKVAGPGAPARIWEAATAKNGTIEHPALRSGYLSWNVTADADRVMLLDASGHTMVYVNGEPRTGDPYSNGIVRLPVELKKGDNEFLFFVGRGQLQAKFVSASDGPQLDTRDLTLPDYVRGEHKVLHAAVVVINPGRKALDDLTILAGVPRGESTTTPLPAIPPLTVRKVAIRLPALPAEAGATVRVELSLWAHERARVTQPVHINFNSAKFDVRVREPHQSRKRTFISDIDGSVQYYAVQPARPVEGQKPDALFLTLHGASVEAIGQADAYAGNPRGPIVAATNRRPYGFDWEDWGRLDALEVLERARRELQTDPARTYLTGHSMGGHGVWHLGATYPDRFAAIAPSAGWISFYTYAGGRRPETPSPVEAMLLRSAANSDTPLLAHNYRNHGIYVLHGEADDNVPVDQARTMRKLLADFHSDFVYHERPGAGHWWGNACVDWPPLFEFLALHTIPAAADARHVEFVTVNPGVSAWCRWAGIAAQQKALMPSRVQLTQDVAKRRISGTTENVARLALALSHFKPDEPVHVELDGQAIANIPWPTSKPTVWLEQADGKWSVVPQPSPALKGPHRNGPFKEAFRNRMLFVYGTKGTAEENAWSYAKARYDAETFWYRGNGAVDVIPDSAFDANRYRDRNVILYGHAESNAAWPALLEKSPVQVRRGSLVVGDKKLAANDLACLFVRPRPDSDRALVGVVSGSGTAGLRLTDRLAYFLSGSGFPDCLVLGPEVLTKGADGVRAAGFFGNDWGVATGDFVWGR
jgi:dienelactone hydrolase